MIAKLIVAGDHLFKVAVIFQIPFAFAPTERQSQVDMQYIGLFARIGLM
jgi:hypothetical protein